jgi:nucleolar protein 14
VLLAAVKTLRTLCAPATKTPSAREFLAPTVVAIERLGATLRGVTVEENDANAKSKTPPPPPLPLTGALKRAAEACVALEADVAPAFASSAKRPPLTWRLKKVEAIKVYNPMYEIEGYQKGRDYDPNRERAEAKKLRRQLKKEARGAVRELRKDNRFLAEERHKESSAAADERGERQRDTLAFLEKLEGDLKSGGQGGMIVKTQRRVNGGGGGRGKKAGGRGGGGGGKR